MQNTIKSLFNNYHAFQFPQPQYLGAKYKHLHFIGESLPNNVHSVADAFAGSQSVSYFFKQNGYEVHTNDFLTFSHKIGEALIENHNTNITDDDIKILLQHNQDTHNFNLMQTLFTNIFFKEEEAMFLDSFRSNIGLLEPLKQPLAFSLINRSITRKVTMGHFAHTSALKYASKAERVKRNPNLVRPIREIFLELVPLYNQSVFNNHQNNKSYNLDAIEFVQKIDGYVDLIYFDPPYCGSHADYQSFYHLLETYTHYWKNKKFVNGTKRYEPKKYSGFDTKKDIVLSLEKLFISAKRTPYWLVSYNDRSFPDMENMKKILAQYKKVIIKEKSYKNSVGGKGSVRGSREFLFICSPY